MLMAGEKRVILSVDDDRGVRLLTERYLSGAGYETLVAETGRQALGIVVSREVDVIVSDLVMPEMDGMELLRAVNAVRPRLPFIMLTSESGLGRTASAIKDGAFDYIRKPVNKSELLDAVARAVGFVKMVEGGR